MLVKCVKLNEFLKVHGISHDIVAFAAKLISNELNSSNANPLVLNEMIINNGNMHGEYMSKGKDLMSSI